MRHFLAATFAAATLALAVVPAGAAPMSTSDLLRPDSAVTKVWKPQKCYNTCTYYGWCGYGYNRHKCCKAWKRVCH